jgi:SSS family solute:Na+ symporter
VLLVPQPEPHSAVRAIDLFIVAGYFAFIIWLGSRFGKRQTSSRRYFLADRTLPGWAVGMSIFATIISSWAFLALPGKSFAADMQYLLTISTIPLTALVATLFIIPVFRNKIKLSAYEYLERRFGLVARFYGNIVFISGHFFKMGMVLYLLCLAIEGVTGWGSQSLIYLIVIVGIVTITYTFFGGIEGVVWTDVIQGFLLLAGGVVGLLFILFSSQGGPSEVIATAVEAQKFRLANFDFDWNNVSLYMLVCFGLTHYLAKYTTDQTVVQRYLLSPSSAQAAKSLWVSVLFLWVVWILFMAVGVVLWAYYQVQPQLLPDSVRAKPDQVFAYFIGHELPVGVTGLILAGVFAAAMSTLSSDLNSLASVLVDDFYNKFAKGASDKTRLRFSRLSVIASGVCAILLAIVLRKEKSMVDAFFSFNAVILAGIVGVFFLGLFSRRCSSRGLYVGLAIEVACVAWAIVTYHMSGAAYPRLPKFKINILWLGLLGNLVVFVAGYLASLIFSSGYRAEPGLTIYKNSGVP